MSRAVHIALSVAALAAPLSPDLAFAQPTASDAATLRQLQALRKEIAAVKKRNASDERQLAELRAALNRILTILAQSQQQSVPLVAVRPPAARVPVPQQVAPAPALPNMVLPPQVQVAVRPPTAIAPAPAPVATRPPAQSSISSVYQGQNALFSHGLTVTPTVTSGYSDNRFFTLNGFLALGAIFLGNINVSRQQSYVNLMNLGLTYGESPRLELAANIPYLVRSATYSSVGANGSSSQPSEVSTSYGGLGDSTLGLYYQAATETATRPNIIVNTQVTIPTGRSAYGTKLLTDRANSNLQYPSGLPTGQGVVGLSGGVSFVKTLDPMIFFGGVNYYHNFASHFADVSTDPNQKVPGQAVPGDAYGFSIGTAFALNERSNLSLSFQDTFQHETRLHPDLGSWSNVVGSATNAATLDIGTTYVFDRRSSVQAQLGFGMTQDAPNYQFSLRFPRKF